MTTLARSKWILPLAGLVTSAVACGPSGSGDAGGASGGASGSGAAGTGAATGSGGLEGSGGSPSGGAPAAGGTTSTGGVSETGGQGGDGASGGASSLGCDGPAAPTGVQELSLEVADVTRTFVLSVPEGTAAAPLPLVFAWHGLGGSGSLARLYFGVEQAADGGAIFVYPDGLPVESSDNQPGWDLAADSIDVAFFDRLLEEVSGAYCVDSERIFSIGHSYGAYMTNRLGCSRGEVLRGVGPVAGGPHFGGGDTCDDPLAAFITHGTLDETVLLEQGQLARDEYLLRSGCDETSTPVSPAPCVQYDGCESGDPVVWCEHDTPAEDAHGWPDFVAAGLWDFLSSLP